MKTGLLISDVDGTLLGDASALDRLLSFLRERSFQVVYCSGRTPQSIAADVDAGRLPPPLGIIGAVGTEIVLGPERSPLTAWTEQLALRRFDAERIRALLADEVDVTLQAASEQRRFKVSYLAPDRTDDDLQRVQHRLEEDGQQVRLVYSSQRDLDVLPAGIDKGAAARFLVEHLGAEQVFTAGDSNNDRALLTAGFAGIIVGNAEPALRDLAQDPGVFCAQGPYAAGVLEGLVHHLDG